MTSARRGPGSRAMLCGRLDLRAGEQVHVRNRVQSHSQCRAVDGDEEAGLDLICPLRLTHLQIP